MRALVAFACVFAIVSVCAINISTRVANHINAQFTEIANELDDALRKIK